MASIQSSSAPLEISTDNGVTWKTIVCLTDVGFNLTRETTTTETYCGVNKGLGQPDVSFSVSAVCETAPTGTQASYKDLLAIANAGTLIDLRLQHDGTGVNFYHACKAYITDVTLTGTSGESITFDIEFEMDGVLDIAP